MHQHTIVCIIIVFIGLWLVETFYDATTIIIIISNIVDVVVDATVVAAVVIASSWHRNTYPW